MPGFKKSSSDSGQMLDIHRKVLHRCRILLIKELDPSHILDHMLGEDGFKTDFRDHVLGLSSREQRIAAFLDRLETRGERAFSLFMEVLKEHQNQLHYVLQETIKNMSEMKDSRFREQATLSGDTVRKVLRTNTKQKEQRLDHAIPAFDSSDDLDVFLDAGDEDKYIDCYAIPMRGRTQTEKWIKHVNVPKTEETEAPSDSTYMAMLMHDLMFKPVDTEDLPSEVKPPPKYCRAFVLDTENRYGVTGHEATPPAENRSCLQEDHKGSVQFSTDTLGSKSAVSEDLSDIPSLEAPAPPVPPKPGHLPPLSLRPPSIKTRTVTPRPAVAEVGEDTKPPTTYDDPPKDPPVEEEETPDASPPPPPRTVSRGQTQDMESNHSNEPQDKPVPLPKPKLDKYPPLVNGNGPNSLDDSDNKPPPVPVHRSSPRPTLGKPIVQQTPDQMIETDFPVDSGTDSKGSTTPTTDTEVGSSSEGRGTMSEDTYNSSTISSCTSTQTLTYEQERRLEEIQSILDETYEAVSPKAEQNPELEPPSFASHEHEVLNHNEEDSESMSSPDHSGGSLSDASKECSPDRIRARNFAEEECSGISGNSADGEATTPMSSGNTVDSGFGAMAPGSDSFQLKSSSLKNSGRPLPPILLPRNLSDVHVKADEVCNSSNDGSYYEDIDAIDNVNMPSSPGRFSSSYLDPKAYARSIERAMYPESHSRRKMSNALRNAVIKEWELAGKVILHRGDLLIAENDPACDSVETDEDRKEMPLVDGQEGEEEHAESSANDPLESFRGTIITYDRSGRVFYLPTKYLKKYGDPEGEPWFYPVEMSSRQAALFLSMEKQEGCFVVYRPSNKSSGATYNLSLCRGNGDVVHYHIVENVHGDVMIEGHDHSFMNIRDLVDYFRRNKSQLATRLRRPLKEARKPITPGYHYDIKYEIDRKALDITGKIIGKGNFGVVCAGIYHNIPVAVKVLQKSDITIVEEDDFIEEASVVMGLKHDNVVRLLGLSCSMKPYFIVTEYVPKGNLRECLQNGTIVSENIDSLFDMCIQAASALFYLESQKYILHRDVAARNFLVTEDRCVKLADFGRARFVTDDYYQASRSESIPVRWAAPEILTHSVYSTKSDVWALGVVFWEVFSSGNRPYAGLSVEQNVIYITEGGRLEKPPGCPTDLYVIMRHCWREDPEERPSCTALYDKLMSKTSIYYSGPIQAKRTSNSSSKSNSASGATLLRSPQMNAGKPPATPTINKQRRVVAPDSCSEDFLLEQMKELMLHQNSKDGIPTSSSETSLVSGLADSTKEEMTRSEKIRKSLRKLVGPKSKRKPSKLDPSASPTKYRDDDRPTSAQYYYQD